MRKLTMSEVDIKNVIVWVRDYFDIDFQPDSPDKLKSLIEDLYEDYIVDLDIVIRNFNIINEYVTAYEEFLDNRSN
jgi:hypothetical protein